MSSEMLTMIFGFSSMLLTTAGGFIGFAVNFGGRLGRLEGDVKSLKTDVSGLKDNMNDVLQRLTALETRAILTANSPLQVKAAGEQLIFETNIDDIILSQKQELFDYIESSGADDELSIQDAAIEAVKTLSIPKLPADARKMIYNKGLTTDDTAKFLGVYVRDMYLEREKGSVA